MVSKTDFPTTAATACTNDVFITKWLEEPEGEADLYRALMVEPGSRISLGSIDPCGGAGSYENTIAKIGSYVQKIDQLQYLMHAEGKHSLLIVLQGLDAGGKDGVVRHILTGMNPAGCRVAAFKQPTAAELRHDFLWRVHPHVPSKGEVAVFNRSHYEDVLYARVHEVVPAVVWRARYDLINDFERLLVQSNDTTVLKFFLHISKEEQLARFKRRLDDPSRHWKISESDYKEREFWDDYAAAFEDMFHRTSTWHAPWFIVPSNNRWFRDLAVSQIITRTLEDLQMKLPEPTVDVERIRRRHHQAEMAAQACDGSIGGQPYSAEQVCRNEPSAGILEWSSPQKKQRPLRD
jgi:PPK2 family polyphosphate:nucleotide phosphotransferase